VVIPASVRAEIVRHSQAEIPNEACGLLVARHGVAERYEPGTNLEPSPHRFSIKPGNPETAFLEDEGYVIGLVHSHISSPAYPSKTDVENARLDWPNRPFLIYSVRLDDLAAFTIGEDGRIEQAPLTLS